jgi:hypothetical protein
MVEPIGNVHPGCWDLLQRVRQTRLTRRQFIPGAAAAGLALTQLRLMAPARAAGLPDTASWPSNNKIKHVVILRQENRVPNKVSCWFVYSF